MTAIAMNIQPQGHRFLSPTTVPLEYIETTIPAGMTAADYRRSLPRRASRWQRLKELAGGAAN